MGGSGSSCDIHDEMCRIPSGEVEQLKNRAKNQTRMGSN